MTIEKGSKIKWIRLHAHIAQHLADIDTEDWSTWMMTTVQCQPNKMFQTKLALLKKIKFFFFLKARHYSLCCFTTRKKRAKSMSGKVQQTWAYCLLHLYNHIMRLQWHSFNRRHAALCVSTSVSGRRCRHLLWWLLCDFGSLLLEWVSLDACVHGTPLSGKWWRWPPARPARCTVYTPGIRTCCRRRRWQNPTTPTSGSLQTPPLFPTGRGCRKELWDKGVGAPREGN